MLNLTKFKKLLIENSYLTFYQNFEILQLIICWSLNRVQLDQLFQIHSLLNKIYSITNETKI